MPKLKILSNQQGLTSSEIKSSTGLSTLSILDGVNVSLGTKSSCLSNSNLKEGDTFLGKLCDAPIITGGI